MAGFFAEGFLLQPTAAEMASLLPKAIDLRVVFRNFKVIGLRYAIMANRWFAGWLQEETFSFVQLCGVGHRGRKPA